jgi:hypothetical protein
VDECFAHDFSMLPVAAGLYAATCLICVHACGFSCTTISSNCSTWPLSVADTAGVDAAASSKGGGVSAAVHTVGHYSLLKMSTCSLSSIQLCFDDSQFMNLGLLACRGAQATSAVHLAGYVSLT